MHSLKFFVSLHSGSFIVSVTPGIRLQQQKFKLLLTEGNAFCLMERLREITSSTVSQNYTV